MRYVTFLTLSILATAPADADERNEFYGVWGTAQQCAGVPIKPGGTVLAAPFEISAEWHKQGEHWCQLNWFPIEKRDEGLFSGAHARCGEDAIRAYFLGMEVEGGELTLRWDVFRSNGPMMRCERP